MVYFVKADGRLYRFGQFSDLENFTGKSRDCFPKDFGKALKQVFPKSEMVGYQSAKFKGWIYENGEPRELPKGNFWLGRSTRCASIADSLGGQDD